MLSELEFRLNAPSKNTWQQSALLLHVPRLNELLLIGVLLKQTALLRKVLPLQKQLQKGFAQSTRLRSVQQRSALMSIMLLPTELAQIWQQRKRLLQRQNAVLRKSVRKQSELLLSAWLQNKLPFRHLTKQKGRKLMLRTFELRQSVPFKNTLQQSVLRLNMPLLNALPPIGVLLKQIVLLRSVLPQSERMQLVSVRSTRPHSELQLSVLMSIVLRPSVLMQIWLQQKRQPHRLKSAPQMRLQKQKELLRSAWPQNRQPSRHLKRQQGCKQTPNGGLQRQIVLLRKALPQQKQLQHAFVLNMRLHSLQQLSMWRSIVPRLSALVQI
mmetsp:Transcript_55979/g.105288  ORF Transcript_55979/g.105288 Transcript_55979/m.105288 type:complete len:326 (-) Transcript_55979:711-1688(-)